MGTLNPHELIQVSARSALELFGLGLFVMFGLLLLFILLVRRSEERDK